jgi:hypothetical protein
MPEPTPLSGRIEVGSIPVTATAPPPAFARAAPYQPSATAQAHTGISLTEMTTAILTHSVRYPKFRTSGEAGEVAEDFVLGSEFAAASQLQSATSQSVAINRPVKIGELEVTPPVISAT